MDLVNTRIWRRCGLRKRNTGRCKTAGAGSVTADCVGHADVENAGIIHAERHVEVTIVADRTGRVADHERGAERSARIDIDPLERTIRKLVREVRVVRNTFVDAVVANAKEQAPGVILFQAGEDVHDGLAIARDRIAVHIGGDDRQLQVRLSLQLFPQRLNILRQAVGAGVAWGANDITAITVDFAGPQNLGGPVRQGIEGNTAEATDE